MKKIDSRIMKYHNIKLVLDAVRTNASISRIALAKKLGLTSASITKITSCLIEAGVLIEKGCGKALFGRKPLLLELNSERYHVLGMELNTEKVIVICCDFKAGIRCKVQRPIYPFGNKDTIMETMADAAEECIKMSGIERENILGLGLAVPGPLNVSKGILINPPNFDGWDAVPITDFLEKRLSMPVCCDKETSAAALAEHCFGSAKGYNTIFCINIYKLGIGGSLLTDNNIFHGFKDGAGEIGHMMIDANGPLCRCGNYGCLEALVTGNAMTDEVKRGLKTMSNLNIGSSVGAEDLTIEDVFRLAQEGMPLCTEVVNKAARNIAIAIGNVVSLLSPELIVLGGTVPMLSPQLVQKVSEYVRSRTYPRHASEIRITTSALGDMSCAVGAAYLAMDTFVMDHLVL